MCNSCELEGGKAPRRIDNKLDWTPEHKNILHEMWMAGASRFAIGERLGRSAQSVASMAHRMNLPPRPRKGAVESLNALPNESGIAGWADKNKYRRLISCNLCDEPFLSRDVRTNRKCPSCLKGLDWRSA